MVEKEYDDFIILFFFSFSAFGDEIEVKIMEEQKNIWEN